MRATSMVRVHRKLIDMPGEFRVVGAELVGVSRRFNQVRRWFRRNRAGSTAGAPFTRTTGDHHGEARVASARPHHRLSQARGSRDGDAFGIHALVGFPGNPWRGLSPCPGRDGAPLVRRGLGVEPRTPNGTPAQKVGVDVAVINRGKANAAFQQPRHVDPFRKPFRWARAPSCSRGPDLAGLDAGIAHDSRGSPRN